MKRTVQFLSAALFLLLLLNAGCQKATNRDGDVVAAKAQLDSLYMDWRCSWCDNDLDRYLSFVDDDAVFLGWPSDNLLAGKPLIEQAARQRFLRTEKADMNPQFTRDKWYLHVTPTVAWAEASVTINYDTPAGLHSQHFLESMVFEKRTDGWKIVQYHRSSISQNVRP